jgi:MoaA/NifB/PqqE/SkfB family radical SAM enzyme
MYSGVFSDCNDLCPSLNAYLHNQGKINHWQIVPLEDFGKVMQYEPCSVNLSYDLSCNLQCPSCRHQLIVWNPNDPDDADGQRIKKIHAGAKQLIDTLAISEKVLVGITGSGDPFASDLYWSYLLELASAPLSPNISLSLQTNGVMMTEQNWESIRPLWPHIKYLNISVDAATEETYKIVRKNGNFKRLQNNLAVLDKMVVARNFPNMETWQMNIIVQKSNYRELKQFVEWGLSFKSTPVIWTNLVAQWGHITDAQFKSMAIWQDNHPDRNELIEIMTDPIFVSPFVRLGNLASYLPESKTP